MANIAKILRVTKQGPAGPRASFDTSYADDAAAAAGGIPEGERFLLDSGRVQARRALISRVAVCGDSNTGNGFSGAGANGNGPYVMYAESYVPWLYVLSGCRFNLVPFGSGLSASASGQRTDQIYGAPNHFRAAITASNAELVLDMTGTNNIAQNSDLDVAVADRVTAWLEWRAAGKRVVALAAYPIGLAQSGNSGGAVSARQQVFNAKAKAAAAANGITWIDCTRVLEVSPGVASTTEFKAGDSLHTAEVGANDFVRALWKQLSALYAFTVDNRANGNFLSAGSIFLPGGTQPPSWHLLQAAGGSYTSRMVNDADGAWWEITADVGSSTAPFAIDNNYNTPVNPSGKKVDAVAEIQVVSGELQLCILSVYTASPLATQQSLLATNSGSGCRLIPGDGPGGILTLRTAPYTLPAGLADAGFFFSFRPVGVCVFRIRRLGIRDLS